MDIGRGVNRHGQESRVSILAAGRSSGGSLFHAGSLELKCRAQSEFEKQVDCTEL